MIATYSSLAMVSSAVIYLLAMCAYALEWAAIRRPADTAPGEEAAVSPRASRFGRIGLGLMLVAVLCHVAGVVLRGVAAQRAPWGNMYEFVTSSLGFAALFALYLIWRRGWGWLGLPITLLLAVGQGLAVTVFYVAVAPLVPALHSVWFIIHIVAAAIAGAAFNLGGIAAILYLFRVRAENKGPVRGYLARMPSAATLDDFSFRVLRFAFPLWTFTILAGAVWADYAWGRFWGWDPEETAALVTWLIYGAYLHARVTRGWQGSRSAWLLLLGFAAVLFAYFGNHFFGGLHSYG